jgi:hypothetical protein
VAAALVRRIRQRPARHRPAWSTSVLVAVFVYGLAATIVYTAYTAAALAFMAVAYLYNLVGGVFA